MRYCLLLIYCVLLGWGLFRPESPPQPAWLPQADKFEHLLAFAVLALGVRALVPARLSLICWSLLLLAAPVLEWLQGVLQPARQFSLLDAAANTAGILTGLLLWHLTNRLRSSASA